MKINLVLYTVLSLAICDLYRRHNKQDMNLYEADQNMAYQVNRACDEIDFNLHRLERGEKLHYFTKP